MSAANEFAAEPAFEQAFASTEKIKLCYYTNMHDVLPESKPILVLMHGYPQS